MKKIVVLLSLGVFLTVSCTKDKQEPQVSNVTFTPCLQSKVKSAELSKVVDVEFSNEGVKISYYDFEVTCDFSIVNVTHTFVNGFLNITQQSSPNLADCICYTDVSYTIAGILQDEVNVIFINGVQVYCHNDSGQSNGDCEDAAKADFQIVYFHHGDCLLYPMPPITLENLIQSPDMEELIYVWSWTKKGSNYDNVFSNSVHPAPIKINAWGIIDITMKITYPDGACSDSKTITITIIPPDILIEYIE